MAKLSKKKPMAVLGKFKLNTCTYILIVTLFKKNENENLISPL